MNWKCLNLYGRPSGLKNTPDTSKRTVERSVTAFVAENQLRNCQREKNSEMDKNPFNLNVVHVPGKIYVHVPTQKLVLFSTCHVPEILRRQRNHQHVTGMSA